MSRIFGAVRQNGYVVRDIHAAMTHWIEVLGVGPWYYMDRVKTDWFRYRGQDSSVEMSIALANSGDLQIELIQQRNDAPSLYREFLDAGHEGLQHMSYWSHDYQALYDMAIGLGYRIGHEVQIGGDKGRFAYFDTQAHPGTIIEISDISGTKGPFFEKVRLAALTGMARGRSARSVARSRRPFASPHTGIGHAVAGWTIHGSVSPPFRSSARQACPRLTTFSPARSQSSTTNTWFR